MKGSRITAVALVAGAALWIYSGHLFPHETGEGKAAGSPKQAEQKLFRVAVEEAKLTPHSRKLVLSGRTEADKKVMAVARTSGIVSEIRVRRGQKVNKGDVIAVLSDEAREAQVRQAAALVAQRRTEFEAKSRLIQQGTIPKLEAGNLEAQVRIAEAALASAEAERERGLVVAPWSGIINDIPAEVGQGMSMGKEIAHILGLDPMLAVVEVAERRLTSVKIGEAAEVRLATGQTATGKVRFVSSAASPVTRTYRVDVEIPNADGAIPDGVTAEVALPLSATNAVRVPRSALTFSSAGELGVRIVGADDKVAFVAVGIVEDEQSHMWVSGVANGARVIVQGQDFVREGQKVAATPAGDVTAQR